MSELKYGLGSQDLILASNSPRRQELFALLGLPFRVVAADIEEAILSGEPPEGMVARLAQTKARAVSSQHPSAVVWGCDTVVVLDGRVLGKPVDIDDARAMLVQLNNRSHAVYTSIALISSGSETLETVETTVWMRNYSDEELEAYIASGDPLDKAGAYGIQNAAFHPVASWDGCYSNVMGLPLCHIARTHLFRQSNSVLADIPAACQSHTGKSCPIFPQILGQQGQVKNIL